MPFKSKSPAEEIRRAALLAIASALEEQAKGGRRKPRLGGLGALATGAVLYTAGRAVAPKLREQLEAQQASREDEEAEDQQAEDEESYDGEPRADAEDEEEPDERDEDYEDEDDEPYAEEDDDYEEEEDEDDEQQQAPARPRRSRSPVGRA